MKQGLNCVLPVEIEYTRIDDAKHVDFIFTQGTAARLLFHYPSSKVKKQGNKFLLRWTYEETYMFDPRKHVHLDTRITMKDSDFNPQTKIACFRMSPTLFTQYEVEHDEIE